MLPPLFNHRLAVCNSTFGRLKTLPPLALPRPQQYNFLTVNHQLRVFRQHQPTFPLISVPCATIESEERPCILHIIKLALLASGREQVG